MVSRIMVVTLTRSKIGTGTKNDGCENNKRVHANKHSDILEAVLVVVTKHTQKHTKTRSVKMTRLTSSKNGTRRANTALTATTMAMMKMTRMKIATSTMVNMAKERAMTRVGKERVTTVTVTVITATIVCRKLRK
jgi:hypothetical protein